MVLGVGQHPKMLSNMFSADFSSSSNYLHECVVQFAGRCETSLYKNTSRRSISVQGIPPLHFSWINKMLCYSKTHTNKMSDVIIYIMIHFKYYHTLVSTCTCFLCSSPSSDNVLQGQKLPRGKVSLEMKTQEADHPMHTALFSRSMLNIFSHLIIYSM